MDSRTRSRRNKRLTTGKLVTGAPHTHPELRPGEGPGVNGDCPASLMERVCAFLDSYPSAKGSAPLVKGRP
jgi:hypothetical protein